MATSALARKTSPLRAPARDLNASKPDASPFIKWVGGKGKLLTQLQPLLPKGVEKMRHVEPFVGGGALFFRQGPKRALLGDVNESLINVYRVIKEAPEELIEQLTPLAIQHTGSDSYYVVRTRYNTKTASEVERAAMFIYLNKTCFNGLHRVNKKGEFNVPAGRYKNPKICNETGIRAASKALKNTTLRCGTFEGLLEFAKPGDFIYLDPPYEPVSRTANFTSYARGGFAQSDQTRLRDVCKVLSKRGCKIMLSNSDVPFIRELYQDDFNIDVIAAPRAINCNGRGRGKVNEVLVRNYS